MRLFILNLPELQLRQLLLGRGQSSGQIERGGRWSTKNADDIMQENMNKLQTMFFVLRCEFS